MGGSEALCLQPRPTPFANSQNLRKPRTISACVCAPFSIPSARLPFVLYPDLECEFCVIRFSGHFHSPRTLFFLYKVSHLFPHFFLTCDGKLQTHYGTDRGRHGCAFCLFDSLPPIYHTCTPTNHSEHAPFEDGVPCLLPLPCAQQGLIWAIIEKWRKKRNKASMLRWRLKCQ